MAKQQDLPTTKIIDFNAVVKQCYNIGKDPDALMDPDSGEMVNSWEFGATKLLERYRDKLFDEETLFPRRTYVCHDSKSTFRTGLFPEYKAKRRQKSEAEQGTLKREQVSLLQQWAKKFFSALGCTQIHIEGVEADDIIAWIVESLHDEIIEVFTVDGDLTALCQKPNVVVNLKLEPFYADLGGYKDVPFELICLNKSLVGDTSDEYPGIKGFGPGAWSKLFALLGEDGCNQLCLAADSNDRGPLNTLLGLYPNSLELGKIDANFAEWRKMWRLAKLHPQLCWKPSGGKLTKPTFHKRVPNRERTLALLQEANLEHEMARFDDMFPCPIGITQADWTDEFRAELAREIAAGDVSAFDYESADKDPNPGFIAASRRGMFVDMNQHTLSGAGFCFGRHLESVIYLPVDHHDTDNLGKDAVLELLDQCYDNTQMVVHNRYFEETITRREFDGVSLGNTHDTQILLRLVDENRAFGLKAAAAELLGLKMDTYQETTQGRRMDELSLEDVLKYGCDDPLATAHLYDLLVFMAKLDGCWKRYNEAWVLPVDVLADSHIKGVRLNLPLLKELHELDIDDLAKHMDGLRSLLEDHCTGSNIDYTGAKAFIEAEREFIERQARAKLRNKQETGGQPEPTNQELREATQNAYEEFETKILKAAEYRPLEVSYEMPRFAFTAKQLTLSSEALGLPPIEKVTKKYLDDWLSGQGAYQVGGDDDLNGPQREFVSALAQAHEVGASKLSAMAGKLLDVPENERNPLLVSSFQNASRGFNKLAKVAQAAAGVEPKRVVVGDELNIGSPVQVPQIIYCKLGMPVEQRNKAALGRIKLGLSEGAPAGNEKAMLWAIANHCDQAWKKEALEHLIAAKRCRTKISLYHTKWPLWVHPKDGLVHPSFMLAGTDTRRPTGSAPNTLQVSKKDPEMRDCFMAEDPDYVTVAIDFNGQELRIIASESKDPEMLRAYDPKDERCIHSTTGVGIAKLMPGISQELTEYEKLNSARKHADDPLHAVASELRKKGKGTNFALTYGAAAPTVSMTLVVPLSDAELFLAGAHSLYTRIKPWQEETAAFMDANGFTVTAYGTKRHATDDLFSNDRGKVSRQHRQGTNATVQACAAEMLATILTEISTRGLLQKLRMVFFAPIYDEVVAFVHRDDVAEYCRELNDIMSNVAPTSHAIPQVPEFSVGPVWGSLEELGRYPKENAAEFFQQAAQAAWEQLQEIYATYHEKMKDYVEPEVIQTARRDAEARLQDKGAALFGDVDDLYAVEVVHDEDDDTEE